MMPTVKRQLSAVQLHENKGNAGMPTVPTLIHARTGALFTGLLCSGYLNKFFSNTRNTSIGTIGITANGYKSKACTAVIRKPTIGKPKADFLQHKSEVTHG